LSKKASKQRAGEHGLLALDWNNGNRNILADPNLCGLLLGQTLQTKDHEIYRALIEATGFGALMIIEQMEKYGITIDKIVSCGGITQKNPFFMQTYADILNRPIEVAENQETVALGAAITGGYVAKKETGEADSIEQIQQVVCSTQPEPYQPRPEENKHYRKLYALYKKVHDAFGREDQQVNLGKVMKRLKSLKEKA
jgi:L-ribulokinase